MKNKQHEHVLKAFIESRIPGVIRRESKQLMQIDSVIGGYCTQLLKKSQIEHLSSNEIISKSEKEAFVRLMSRSSGFEKDELLVYYRLIILVESVIMQYI